MGRWPPFFSHAASLPEVVVLPEPCRPAMRMTVGGCEANLKRAVSVPRVAMSSSRTILTICSEGLRAVATSLPRDLARIFSMRSLTTVRLTSDSSRARRISRRASLMFSSVRVPWPRRFLKERWSFSERFSNMAWFSLSAGFGRAETNAKDAEDATDRNGSGDGYVGTGGGVRGEMRGELGDGNGCG